MPDWAFFLIDKGGDETMNPTVRRFVYARWLDYVLPCLIFTFGLQLMRVFIPGLAWYLRDAAGVPTLQLIPYAVGTFLLGFSAALLRRLIGDRRSLWITAGGVAVIRVVEQWSTDPSIDLWLSILGLGLFLIFIPIFIGHVRGLGERATPRWAYGLLIGFAFDIVLRGVFGAVDLSWISGAFPLLIIALISVLVFWSLSREPTIGTNAPSESGLKQALPLMAMGPYMMLQVLLFSSQGYVEEVAGLSPPLGFIIVLVGYLASAVGIIWGLNSPRALHPMLALGIAIYLMLAAYGADEAGRLILVTILLGQFLMGLGLAVISTINASADRPGLLQTTIMIGLGMLLFLILVFGYYVAQDLSLPFPRPVIPAAGGALFGLLILSASVQLRSRALTSQRNLSGFSVIGALTLIPFLYWAVQGASPSAVEPSEEPVKVMTYNIHSAFDSTGRQDLEAIANVIEDSGADVIALQEVSRVRFMDGFTDIPNWLSRRLEMPFLFQGTEEPIWGNAILTRYPILDSGSGELPRVGTLIERGYLWASIDAGGPQPLLVVVTHLHHLSPDSVERQAQVPVLLQFWDGQTSSILLGDMNAEPDSTEMKMVAEAGLLDAWDGAGVGSGYTFSSTDPVKRIDWIWHSDNLQPLVVQVVQTQASDHMPVLATFELMP
jgi:endonuclease/exonuclease/phosphatase family metal-dependent hydrolase